MYCIYVFPRLNWPNRTYDIYSTIEVSVTLARNKEGEGEEAERVQRGRGYPLTANATSASCHFLSDMSIPGSR